jgi:hypothetical protein
VTLLPANRDHGARDVHNARIESRLAFPDQDEGAEETATPTRRFSAFETTTLLPDDSRDADEHADARRLREMRARMKAARFYARCGMSGKPFGEGFRTHRRGRTRTRVLGPYAVASATLAGLGLGATFVGLKAYNML